MNAHDTDAIAALLDHHYGDGLVYFRDQEDRTYFQAAKSLGLVNDEGYLTPRGLSFWRRASALRRSA